MKKTLLATAAAVAVLASLWIAWPADVVQPVAPQHDAVAALETQEPSKRAAPSEAGAPEASTERVLASASSTAGPGWLCGRCVDEQGHAVADARVEVRANPVLAADRTRKLSVAPRTTNTAADGSFRVALEPAGFRCEATIEAAGRVLVEGALGSTDAGQTIDLGAVVLETGCVVTGRVVDGRGVPIDETVVSLEWTGHASDPSPRLLPRKYVSAVSKDGGVLAFPGAAPSGTFLVTWMVKATRFWEKGPDLVIAAGQQRAVLEIECPALDDLPWIEGAVVDEQGVPIEAASVSCEPAVGRAGSMRTSKDGRFRIVGNRAAAGCALVLRVAKRGLTQVTHSDHRFGDAGVTLVMKRLPSVEIVAVQQGTGEPVEDFGVRLFPDPLCYGGSGQADQQERGHHPEGRVALTASRKGRHLLVVEPLSAALAASRFHVVEVGDQTETQRVEIPRMIARRLLVKQSDGRPVVGTKVQLLAPTRGVDVHENTRVIPADELTRMSCSGVQPEDPHFGTTLAQFAEAVLVQAGESDASGELVLRAGARSDLALKVLGPGHLPVFVPQIDLAADGPLCITVETGATVTGRLEPARVVHQLRAALRFIAIADPRQQVPEAPETEPAKGFPIRDDGGFTCEDIPPGDWKVYLAIRHSGEQRVIPIGVVERLRSGETRTLDAAVHHLEPGSLRGLVLLDGRRHGGARVELRSDPRPDEAPLLIGGRLHVPGSSGMLLTADEQGAFAAELFPGAYRLSLLWRDGDGNEQRIVCPTEVTVPPGGRAEQAFALRHVRVTARILDVTQQPVSGRAFFLECSASEAFMARQLTTDASGSLVIDPAPLTEFHLSTWPAELVTPRARSALRSRDAKALDGARIRLGPFTVPGDQNEVALELHLPPLR